MFLGVKNRLTIYHGSRFIVETPLYGVGNPRNDYGLGFYCTQSLDLAKEWAVTDSQDGYANGYELDMGGLSCLDLSSPGFNILNWIAILLENRVFTLRNDVTKAGRQYFLDNFALPYGEYDIIKGYRADDSYFAYAEAFLNNAISCQRLSEAMRLGNLGEQIVLKSEAAFERISYLGCEVAPSSIFLPMRMKRNEEARLAFLSNKAGAFSPDALYLADIIRFGVDADDPRLR